MRLISLFSSVVVISRPSTVATAEDWPPLPTAPPPVRPGTRNMTMATEMMTRMPPSM
jgi:hypothetical protein